VVTHNNTAGADDNLQPDKEMTINTTFYFRGGVASALVALAIIPIRTTTIGQSPAAARLLGSAPSFFGLLALLLLLLSTIKPKSSYLYWIIVITITAGTLTHEILQNWTGKTFDYRDLEAIACGFLAFCLIHFITRGLTKRNSNRRFDPAVKAPAKSGID